MMKYAHNLAALAFIALYFAWQLVVSPYDGSGPGAVAAPGVRENPASWKAVYVPYVVTNGGGGGGGYSFGK